MVVGRMEEVVVGSEYGRLRCQLVYRELAALMLSKKIQIFFSSSCRRWKRHDKTRCSSVFANHVMDRTRRFYHQLSSHFARRAKSSQSRPGTYSFPVFVVISTPPT